jgi:lipoprotein-releasing system ATP-binding protein
MPESTPSAGAAPESSPTRAEAPRRDLSQANLLVEVREMSKSFRHGTRQLDVLRGVNLTLREGEMVTIIGASGAGKSTLLHCLGTLDLPTGGEILFWPRGTAAAGPAAAPTDITRLSPPDLADFRNRTIGFVFQFHHLLPEFTALENVMMPALIARLPAREAKQRAEAMLASVAMSHRLAHRPGELSGGEQQRVAIARALVMQPRLLLADEPTGNLDTRTSAEVHELLFRLNAEHALSMLVVTHNMELAEQMPRVVRMADGRILEGAGDAGE